MTVKFSSSIKPAPGKLADAELHFDDPLDGALYGLKLVGFAVWTRQDGSRNVTFPARQYTIDGERRTFIQLRPIQAENGAQARFQQFILDAYAATEGAEVPS